jgi:thiosulfate/3-mercaptopyruvate sulfurtransferase
MVLLLVARTVSKRSGRGVGRAGLSNAASAGRGNVLVKPAELAAKLDKGENDIVVFDSSWHMPGSDRNAREEFMQDRIPTAQFFDIDSISDSSSPLPHTLPTAEFFQEAAREFGVTNESTVVTYDSVGLFSSARCWWLFKYFGHRNVYILDGGLPAWKGQNFETIAGDETNGPQALGGSFRAVAEHSRLASLSDMNQSKLNDTKSTIFDARGGPRFNGDVDEPREGVRTGHIPGSVNVPFQSLLTEDGSGLLDTDLLTVRLDQAAPEGLIQDTSRPIITSCGSGVTACIILAALEIVGRTENTKLFDGSWTEYGMSDLPVDTKK